MQRTSQGFQDFYLRVFPAEFSGGTPAELLYPDGLVPLSLLREMARDLGPQGLGGVLNPVAGIPTIGRALRLRLTAIVQLGDDLHLTAQPATKEN